MGHWADGTTGSMHLTRISCRSEPPSLEAKLEAGLTACGDAIPENVKVVYSNLEMMASVWKLIGAQIVAPGMDGLTVVWANTSRDLNSESIILAADTVAQGFSIWNFPSRVKVLVPRQLRE